MSASAQWSDLAPRVLSAVAMAVIGAIAIWFGNFVFLALICVICGLMAWEVVRMFALPKAVMLGVAMAAALMISAALPGFLAVLVLGGAGVGVAQCAERERAVLLGVVLWLLLGCYAFLSLRFGAGMGWILWLILVVIASDVAGYFAGRSFGGPKFWPRISPKKTWSGTVAGWVAAGAVGAACAPVLNVGLGLIWISVLVGFAGQMGDIAQSLLKRRQGIKDSSDLIPGHGGVFDRFDAMLGGSVIALVLWAFGFMPGALG